MIHMMKNNGKTCMKTDAGIDEWCSNALSALTGVRFSLPAPLIDPLVNFTRGFFYKYNVF